MVMDKFPKTVQANDMIDAINAIARIQRNSLLVKGEDAMRRELDRIPGERKKIGETLDKLTATITSDAGKAVLKGLVASRAAYVPLQEKFDSLMRAGKRDEATDLLMGDLRKVFNDYLKAVNELIAYQTKLMEDTGKKAEAEANAAQKLLLICWRSTFRLSTRASFAHCVPCAIAFAMINVAAAFGVAVGIGVGVHAIAVEVY